MENSKYLEYSFGTDKFDNQPKQLNVCSFDAFKIHVLQERSEQKGFNYFCSAFNVGTHSDREKYPEIRAYRLKKLAKKRRFIALDFDGFSSVTSYENTFDFLKRYRGFGYETWSHTPSIPRARAVLELSSAINSEDSARLGFALELEIEKAVGRGQIKFDKSVYALEQPIYGPPINARIYHFDGLPLVADEIICDRNEVQECMDNLIGSRPMYLSNINDCTNALAGKMTPPDETPRQIMILMNMLQHISADCDYETYRRIIWAILSTGWDCAVEIALDWSLTAPDRFNQATFDSLLSGFNPSLINCPSYGTIKFLALVGGWNG